MDPGTTSVIFFPTNFSKPLATRTVVTAVHVRTMSSVCQHSMLRGEPTVWSEYVCQRPVQHALDFTIFAAIATPSLQLARERRDYVPLHFSQAHCPTDKSKTRYLRPIFQNVSHSSDVFLLIREFIRRVETERRGGRRRFEALCAATRQGNRSAMTLPT